MRALIAAGFAFALAATPAAAEDCCGAESPFRMGEAMPDRPARCATLPDWIGRAPETQDRVSMAITGELVEVTSDGALAYLLMCDAAEVQVLCLTYDTLGMKPGETVTLAGGYVPAGKGRVMLDPCLASRPAGAE